METEQKTTSEIVNEGTTPESDVDMDYIYLLMEQRQIFLKEKINMNKSISVESFFQSLSHMAFLLLFSGFIMIPFIWITAYQAQAEYDVVDPTNITENRNYAEVILNDNGKGYADTFIELNKLNNSLDKAIYVRYRQRACRVQTLRIQLLGNLPASYNRVAFGIFSIRDHEYDYYDSHYDVDNENKTLCFPTETFGYWPDSDRPLEETVIRIIPFIDKDSNGEYHGDAEIRITLEPTKTLENCEVTLDKETYLATDKPVPTVTFLGQKLIEGKDYEITEIRNLYPNPSWLTLKGLGDFSGENYKENSGGDFFYRLAYKEVDFKVTGYADDAGDSDTPGVDSTSGHNKALRDNPMTAKAKKSSIKVKYSALKKKSQTIKTKNIITVKNAPGKVTFKKSSGNKKITVDKATGKITIKKGLKKGTYPVTIKVTAWKTARFKASTQKVSFKIIVK